MITIYYPATFENERVLEEVEKYGDVRDSISNWGTRELTSKLKRHEIQDLERFFKENQIPYDLMEYGTDITTPKLKKSRPEHDFEKEIRCEFYQEEEVDALIPVSALLSVIENSDKNEVVEKILEEIKKATFQFDEVEDIFEY